MTFESPSLLTPCFADPGDGYGAGYGRSVGDNCMAADWIHEPRTLGTQGKDYWIKIWMEDQVTLQPRVFDMPIIRVTGTEPIQFWLKRSNGSWWYWSSLAPNPWLVGGWVYDVTEARIRGAQAANGPYFIGAFSILDQADVKKIRRLCSRIIPDLNMPREGSAFILSPIKNWTLTKIGGRDNRTRYGKCCMQRDA